MNNNAIQRYLDDVDAGDWDGSWPLNVGGFEISRSKDGNTFRFFDMDGGCFDIPTAALLEAASESINKPLSPSTNNETTK